MTADEMLAADPTFAEVCDARRDAWIAAMEADSDLAAPLPELRLVAGLEVGEVDVDEQRPGPEVQLLQLGGHLGQVVDGFGEHVGPLGGGHDSALAA